MVIMGPSRSPVRKRRKRKFVGWLMAGTIMGFVLLSGIGGYWMAQNAKEDSALFMEVATTLHHDQKLGVPTSQLTAIDRKLFDIRNTSFVFLPSRFFGSAAGVPQKLHSLQTQASRLPASDLHKARQLAVQWGRKMIAEQGAFAVLNAAQISQKVESLSGLGPLRAQIRLWETQYNSWRHALESLASLGGGLSHDQPKRVLAAAHNLKIRLATRGQYWQGVAPAESALSRTQKYLHESPPQELSQYASVMASLTQADQGLQPPTNTQLLNILGSISQGLKNNQPLDIVEGLSTLKARLKGANSQWTGYSQARSAANSTSAYLGTSVLNQINQHQQILTSLNSAIEGLKAPVPIIPTTLGNPFGPAFQQYLDTRQSQVSVAVYNANTGATYTFNPGVSFDTASIVKATIMATLLWQSQKSGTPLTPSEKSIMVPMIEDSSNSAATALWDQAGRAQGIGAFLAVAGMDQTTPGRNGYWGLTQTTTTDQVTLLKLLSYPNQILSAASQSYAASLMTHVVGWEAWGVSSGPTPGTIVALKNGWLPIGSQGWEINSIGHISGNGRNYVVAILSRNNPSEAYGIQTLDEVSQYIWNSQ